MHAKGGGSGLLCYAASPEQPASRTRVLLLGSTHKCELLPRLGPHGSVSIAVHLARFAMKTSWLLHRGTEKLFNIVANPLYKFITPATTPN